MDNILHKKTSELQEDLIAKTQERVEEINAHIYQDILPDGFEVDDEGVWYLPNKKIDPPERVWISSSLWVTAYTRDHRNENHGRILEFQDIDGHRHVWTMGMELLSGETTKIIAVLLNFGLRISHKKQAKDRLLEYISQCAPMKSARCVLQCGWYNSVFVLPSQTIGYIQNEKVIFQNRTILQPKIDNSGTVFDWRMKVGELCCGNSRLILAISASFAGPILYLLNHENIGIHYRGSSSLGKSTALHVGNSVWGPPAGIFTFRATANGLEGIASLHNDRLLCLDELGQISAHEAGHVVYMLGNGMGKARADQHGLPKNQMFWRLIFLSNGELSLSQLLNEIGKSSKAGQEVRLIEISADTGKYGMFEDLHGFEGGAEFSTYLRDACAQFYGTPSNAFLNKLVEDIPGAIERIREIIEVMTQRYCPKNSSAQVIRVFNHFALIAAAGELASSFGITGWEVEEAISGVMKCFQDWLDSRGLGLHEEEEALSQVRRFFEHHGESRFSPWFRDQNDTSKTANRAGYRKETEEGTEFYVFSDAFRKEICKGIDYHLAEKVCIQHELLLPDSNNSPTRSERLAGNSTTSRCYRFSPKVLLE